MACCWKVDKNTSYVVRQSLQNITDSGTAIRQITVTGDGNLWYANINDIQWSMGLFEGSLLIDIDYIHDEYTTMIRSMHLWYYTDMNQWISNAKTVRSQCNE